MPDRATIFWPILAMAALTFSVAIRMFMIRVGEMRARRIHPQAVATSREAATQFQDVAAADNFRNLFELPVLFYVLCLALYLTDGVTALQLGLAWAFVALRWTHSLVHVTYNKVMHRFRAYALGLIVLMTMWIAFALRLAG
jgi:hypothetical protein